LSWYPTTKLTELPWILLVVPTEPLLRAVKGIIPPAFGVDITPVFWLAIFTFIHEILLGQQGLLTLKLKYGI
jgi:YggT family protein